MLDFAGFEMSSLGGRGFHSSYRGRGGRGFPPLQHGNKSLINSDISGTSLLKKLENNPEVYKKLKEMLNESNPNEGCSSYANIANEDDEYESYNRKDSEQVIIILEDSDMQWQKEPWNLLSRYLGRMGSTSYAHGSYKQRHLYESMLKTTESCEVRHFLPMNQEKIYNFSKIIIKQIISVEEWGLNPMAEKQFILQGQNTPVNFNFWDYKEAFYKAFLYQNPQRKHTWFIKICPFVYKKKLPNWFYHWWLEYGASEKIIPSPFIEKYHEWKKVSPAIIEAEYDKKFRPNMAVLHFFCEFGIPWIWRWEPEAGFNNDNTPVLKRIPYVKFWKKMIRNDSEGLMEARETLSLIDERILEYSARITSKNQRSPYNPFDIIEARMDTPNMSKEEKYRRFMEEAKQAIIQKLGPEVEELIAENSRISGDNDDLMDDSQDPYDLEDDANMARFFSKLNDDAKVVISDSEDNNPEDDKTEEKDKQRKRKGKKKK